MPRSGHRRTFGGNKYNARRVVVDGIKFDSQGEANRYQQLLLLEKAGEITDLKRQPFFYFVHPVTKKHLVIKSKGYPNGRKVKYVADFSYRTADGLVVEDYKGFDTDVSRLKRAMMELFHGITVRIVK